MRGRRKLLVYKILNLRSKNSHTGGLHISSYDSPGHTLLLKEYEEGRVCFLSRWKGLNLWLLLLSLVRDGHSTIQALLTWIIGTSSIVDEKTHEPLLSILSLIVETAVKLHKDGHKVIIVSSGAIGVGLRRMDLEKRPKHLPRIQVSRLKSAVWELRFIGFLGIGSDWTM